eukprot:3852939-Pleurochrysis_carterae.AAC.1
MNFPLPPQTLFPLPPTGAFGPPEAKLVRNSHKAITSQRPPAPEHGFADYLKIQKINIVQYAQSCAVLRTQLEHQAKQVVQMTIGKTHAYRRGR